MHGASIYPFQVEVQVMPVSKQSLCVLKAARSATSCFTQRVKNTVCMAEPWIQAAIKDKRKRKTAVGAASEGLSAEAEQSLGTCQQVTAFNL